MSTLSPEAKARRLALGIPVHEADDEHEWRADGYCNCGAQRRPARQRVQYASTRDGGVVAKSNLDLIERNEDNR